MKSLRTTAIRSHPASELWERFLTNFALSRDGDRYRHPIITSRREGDDTADAVSKSKPGSPLRRRFVPPKVAQCRSRCEAPDGAIADGFASRNGRTIEAGDSRSRLA
jgi:hypothetical protein